MNDLVFLALCFLLDFVVEVLFSSDPAMVGFIAVPCCAFFGMLLLVRGKSWVNGIYWAFLVGCCSDFFAMNRSLDLALLFILSALIMRGWEKHLSSSLFEQMILLLSTLFIKEALLYLCWLAGGSFQMSLMTWLLHRCIPTILLNLVLVVVVLKIMDCKQEADARKERNKRREESLFWKKFK